MTTNHTPGPWHYGKEFKPARGFGLQDVISISVQGQVVAHVNCGFNSGEQDARLIAVAPELLQLAEQYASECGECAGTGITPDDSPCEECRFIRAVISKVTGEDLRAANIAEHAYLRGLHRSAVTGEHTDEEAEDLRDAGRGHLVRS